MSEARIDTAQPSDRLYAGIDAGSVSLNCIVVDERGEIVCELPYQRHLGKVEEGVLSLVQRLHQQLGEERIRSISFTGSHGKKLAERLGLLYEFETISQVLGAIRLNPEVRTIISMGGQDTALLQIGHHGRGWELEYFNTNGPCASGTGSFIDQQAERLAVAMYSEVTDASQGRIDKILADFIERGMKSERPANVACRCTVFTKSDMIHLQNKGERLEDIIHGLHVGNARNYMSTIVSNRELREPILFIGGLSLNVLQVQAFREYFPALIVPPYCTSIGALGVALQAFEAEREDHPDFGLLRDGGRGQGASLPVGAKLELRKTAFPETNEIECRPWPERTRAWLGIDVGSTTTKYALIDEAGRIIHKKYVTTQGKPVEVTQRLLAFLQGELGEKIEIAGTATTGSGRNVVGDFLDADLIIDEITAHARGAVEIDRDVDTIFEIGGQDSKYISIANADPLDFDMNKVCAAGTGSFLHELASKHGINIVGEFQEIALSSEMPIKLAERCTVFMESDLVSYHQQGVDRTDLIAGLCYAIAHNYLNRVVGKRKIGRRVMFLGGPSLNKGVVAAFENLLGRALIVPRHREVLGAYGAALSVQERMRLEGRGESRFRGLAKAIDDRMEYTEKTCRADARCHNQCKLKVYDFDGRRSVWGGECGRYEVARSEGPRKANFFELRQEIWQAHMAGAHQELSGEPLMEVDGRPTVGMQRALYGQQTSLLWAHFFERLGLRLVLTPPTNARISAMGIETMVAETCYPVKVSYGHMRELEGKTRHLFSPTIVTMPTPDPSETGFLCPLVQSNSYMVRAALGLDPARVWSPVLHLKHDPERLALEISRQMKGELSATTAEIRDALDYALARQSDFTRELHRKGREVLEQQVPGDPIVVVTGRPYNLYDERLNLRLGRNLAKIGMTALPMDFIDVSSVPLSDFPSMYWGLGAQILRTARYVAERPNLFGLHLTNFACGADSFLEHFYKYLMGDRAYLILEVDEHSAVAGVMTRLEAYRNVIENTLRKERRTEGRLGKAATTADSRSPLAG